MSYKGEKNKINWNVLMQNLSAHSNIDGALWREQEFIAVVQHNRLLQKELGVRSTPTWFVDGFRLRGLQSPLQVQRVIDLALMDKQR